MLRSTESIKQPFWIVLTACVTFLLWFFVSLTIRISTSNRHAEAYALCAREVNVKVLGMTKSNTDLMRACMLGYGYNDKFE